jgi:MFS family permease
MNGVLTLQIGGGTLGDLFDAKERGKAVALYSIVILLGPVLGPVVGGVVSQHLGWQWTFYMASITDALVQILGLFLLQETYAPVLLRRRQRRRDKENGTHRTPQLHPLKHLRERLGQNLSRAALLLATQPIVQVLALYNAFLYGIIFIIYATFSDLWLIVYGQTPTMAGLHYISLGVGAAFAGEVSTLINDRIYAVLCARNSGRGRPELRIPIMIPSTVVLGVGLFWYGWSAAYELPWIMPDIGIALFMSGAITCGISVNAYIVDTYGQFSASALAAVAVLRCLAAFSFPLFAPYM